MPEIFERIGVHLEVEGDDIRIDQKEIYEIENFIDGSTLTIADAPWPVGCLRVPDKHFSGGLHSGKGECADTSEDV